MKRIRWGIIGTGNIANQFAAGLLSLSDAQIVAIGSRDKNKSESFGARFGIPYRHASYMDLAHNPNVDVVYIATPSSCHKENIRLCLNAGKAVLCEKPFTISANEAAEVIAISREKSRFLMEAMSMRFTPALAKVLELLASGIIGEVRMIKSDFGYKPNCSQQSRLFDLALGGGALLDLGIYPLSLGHMILGKPSKVTCVSCLGRTGVDELSAVLLGYEGGQIALFSCSLCTYIRQETLIIGTEGDIKIHPPFNLPIRITLRLFSRSGTYTIQGSSDIWAQIQQKIKSFVTKRPIIQCLLSKYGDFYQRLINELYKKEFCLPLCCNGYNYEAIEVMSCLRNGKLESEIMPLDETLAIIETLDHVRYQCGLKYRNEQNGSLL
ncbi:MAG: Gfo/Idh/MocA family oxidoreductase [Patescibacteria group bacterium]|nr:Gfo/Idh/MocA family oxidoreductase [Patescibacteria group bacterium]